MDYLLQEGMSFEEGAAWIDKFRSELSSNKLGLDPYPIALRGINWIKFIVRHNDKISSFKRTEWNNSLYSQYKLLSKKLEYHLLGNHLLEDAFSLFFAAIYFEDKVFYAKAVALLRRELDEQILADGAHYEQSPMYHCILLDRLLDCYNISKGNKRFSSQDDITLLLKAKAEAMLGHLESIVYADGSIPLLNDSAVGIAPNVDQIREYALRLGLEWNKRELGECGYRKLCAGRMEAIVDVGNITASYQAGHTHADTFSFELRVDGKPLIVDTGISTYNKTERRGYERSTAAHNTVVVNGRDSSEVWGGFRVGNRAKVSVVTDKHNEIEAVHNGYGNKLLHNRSFKCADALFVVGDRMERECAAVSYIHFAPEVEVLSCAKDKIDTNVARLEILGASVVELLEGEVSKEYNKRVPTKIVKISFSKSLQLTIR